MYHFSMKRELRRKYLDVRKNILKRDKKDEAIFRKVIKEEFVREAETILIYVSLKDEVDTRRLITYFLASGFRVAVPKVDEKTMIFYYIESFNDLERGYKNVLEPTCDCTPVLDFTRTICITPGVCFNKKGYRIGYGGGYYDRFLAEKNIISIGLCYKECLIDENFSNEFDIPVNKIITN